MMLFGLLLLACNGVSGDRILARDFAAADPRFSAAPAETMVAYAPVPGAQRTFAPAELTQVAKRLGVAADFQAPLCFEHRMEALDPARVLEAMKMALQVPEASVEITALSLYPVPKGVLVFPRAALRAPPALQPGMPVTWNGFVEYAPSRRFNVWATVKLRVKEVCVAATEDLPAGRVVEASHVRLDTIEGFPHSSAMARSVEEVTGHTLRKPIKKGLPISRDAVATGAPTGPQPDVVRGDVVQVEVQAGAAHLAFEGRAETEGAAGQKVTIRNTSSGKSFQATVAAKGKVVVSQ